MIDDNVGFIFLYVPEVLVFRSVPESDSVVIVSLLCVSRNSSSDSHLYIHVYGKSFLFFFLVQDNFVESLLFLMLSVWRLHGECWRSLFPIVFITGFYLFIHKLLCARPCIVTRFPCVGGVVVYHSLRYLPVEISVGQDYGTVFVIEIY